MPESAHEYYELLCASSVDGALTEQEREELQQHLAACPRCKALSAQLAQLHEQLGHELPLPQGFDGTLRDKIHQSRPTAEVQTRMPSRLPLFAIGMVAVACIVVWAMLPGGLMGQFFSDTAALPAATSAGGSPADMAREAAQPEMPQTAAYTEESLPLQSPALPEELIGLRVSHYYIAERGNGLIEFTEQVEVVYEDKNSTYFLFPNSTSSLGNTLSTLEKAGFRVAAGVQNGLTIDSTAESWLLVIVHS